MLLHIHPEFPHDRKINLVADTLVEGGVIIFPTDSVYGIGCDIFDKKAVEKVCRIRQLDPKKAMLTFICKDISQIAEYAWQLDNHVFRIMKKNLPGPFTFILKSNNAVPKMFKNRKRTIGVRIPDNNIALAIVERLGRPILSISLKTGEAVEESFEAYLNDPAEIYEEYGKLVDIVVDGGTGGSEPSTLIDTTGNELEILRQGKGTLIV